MENQNQSPVNKQHFYWTYCDAENQVDIFASGEDFLGFLQNNEIHGPTGSFLWTKEEWAALHRRSTEAEYKDLLEDYQQYPEDHAEPNFESMLAEEVFCIGVGPAFFKEISGIDVTDYYPDLSKAKEADLSFINRELKVVEPLVTEISVPDIPIDAQ